MALEGNQDPDALCQRIIELSTTDVLGEFPEGSHILPSAPLLETLSFVVLPEGRFSLGPFPSLTSLEILSWDFLGEQDTLTTRCPRLKKLVVFDQNVPDGSSFKQPTLSFPTLEALTCYDACFLLVCAETGFPRLRELEFSGVNISADTNMQ